MEPAASAKTSSLAWKWILNIPNFRLPFFEVVLSVLRKDLDEGEKDWALYESEQERVFGEAEDDNRLRDRKRELRALLEPKDQTIAIAAAYFGKFSLTKLWLDLRSFIDEKRETLDIKF